jgi:hypothetical protein
MQKNKIYAAMMSKLPPTPFPRYSDLTPAGKKAGKGQWLSQDWWINHPDYLTPQWHEKAQAWKEQVKILIDEGVPRHLLEPTLYDALLTL